VAQGDLLGNLEKKLALPDELWYNKKRNVFSRTTVFRPAKKEDTVIFRKK
jgi:hypothetical protein